jgi:hypothetical protein
MAFAFLVGTITTIIRLAATMGLPLGWILGILGLNFINLDDIIMTPYQHYFIFFVTPVFNIETFNDSIIQSLKTLFPDTFKNVVVSPQVLSSQTMNTLFAGEKQ